MLPSQGDRTFNHDVPPAAYANRCFDGRNIQQRSRFSVYESSLHIEALKRAGIVISMDGRGRAFDNIFVERFWRSVKYGDIYLKG